MIGIELAGPVTDQIQAFGRLVQATNPHAVDQRGLARVGYFVGGSFLTLAGRQWQVTGGNAGRSFSDVTGTSAYGRGASVAWTNAPWSVASLAAVPISVAVPGAGDGHLVGMRVSRDVWRPGASVNATMTDLQDPQLTQRRLQAVGIGMVSPAYSGVTASGELAQRWFAGGEGLGWITELRRQTSRDFGQLRFVHAPGGSAAFANAKDALTATGSRMLSRRLAVSAGVWTSDDDNATFSRLHTQGVVVQPPVRSHAAHVAAARSAGEFVHGQQRRGTAGQRGAVDPRRRDHAARHRVPVGRRHAGKRVSDRRRAGESNDRNVGQPPGAQRRGGGSDGPRHRRGECQLRPQRSRDRAPALCLRARRARSRDRAGQLATQSDGERRVPVLQLVRRSSRDAGGASGDGRSAAVQPDAHAGHRAQPVHLRARQRRAHHSGPQADAHHAPAARHPAPGRQGRSVRGSQRQRRARSW